MLVNTKLITRIAAQIFVVKKRSEYYQAKLKGNKVGHEKKNGSGREGHIWGSVGKCGKRSDV